MANGARLRHPDRRRFFHLAHLGNIDTTNGEMLPMLGSLNAAFEALSAYHFLAKHRQQPDSIYDAVLHSPLLTSALQIFYR